MSQLQQSEAGLRVRHTEELTSLQRRMHAELEKERARLLNQLRQLTKIKEKANAEV